MSQIRAAVARQVIDPELPVHFAGDVFGEPPATKIHQSLYAQALVVDDGHQRLAFLTADVTKLSHAMLHQIHERMGEQLGLSPAATMVAASHTHSAPWTVETDADPAVWDPQFADGAVEGLVKAATEAVNRLQPVQYRFASGFCDFGINKRLQTPWGAQMRANPTGPYDPSLDLWVVDDLNGNPLAIVGVYGSHLISHLRSEVSSDCAGFFRAVIEEAFPGCMAFFALGCAGDVSPRCRWEKADYEIGNPHTGAGRRNLSETQAKELMQREGERMAAVAVEVVNETRSSFGGRAKAALSTLELPLQAPATVAQLEAALSLPLNNRHRRWASLMLSRLQDGIPPVRSVTYPVQIWHLGDGVILVGLGGEVFSEIGLRIKRSLMPSQCVVVGHANEYKGYVPTRQAIQEGGFEPESLIYQLMVPANYSPEVEDMLVDHVTELGTRMRLAV